MQRVGWFPLLLILLISLFLFMSCAQDPTHNSSDSNLNQATNQEAAPGTERTPTIQGTWYWTKDGKEYYLRLDSNRKGILHYWQNYGGRLSCYANAEVLHWAYDAESNYFTITIKGEIAGHYNVDYLTNSRLRLSRINGQHDIGFGLVNYELTR